MIRHCLNCNYKGYVYGVPTSNGVSAPFCPNCGMNNKLVVIEEKKSNGMQLDGSLYKNGIRIDHVRNKSEKL